MKQFLDYIPLAVFFIIWTLDERVINIAGFDYTLGEFTVQPNSCC